MRLGERGHPGCGVMLREEEEGLEKGHCFTTQALQA